MNKQVLCNTEFATFNRTCRETEFFGNAWKLKNYYMDVESTTSEYQKLFYILLLDLIPKCT